MVASKEYSPEEINIVTCVETSDKYACLEKIDRGDADITRLDSGTAYFASVNFVSSLLASENYGDGGKDYTYLLTLQLEIVKSDEKTPDKCSTDVFIFSDWFVLVDNYAVAVVPRTSTIYNSFSLRGKRLCSTGNTVTIRF